LNENKGFNSKQKKNKSISAINSNLREGEKLIIQNIINKQVNHRDIVRMKISVPENILRFKGNNFEVEIPKIQPPDHFNLEFLPPTLLSLVNYNNFFFFLKSCYIVTHLIGIVYFSYKIYLKYRQRNIKRKPKVILALPGPDDIKDNIDNID
jgi:hypothetical protein